MSSPQTANPPFQLHERRRFSPLLIQCAGNGLHAAGVKVIDQTLEADDEIVVFIERIDILCCRDDANIMLPQVVDKQGCLRSVSAQP